MLALTACDNQIQETERLLSRSEHNSGVRERTEALLQNEVDFIPNASFVRCDHEAEDSILISSTQFDGPAVAAE